MWTACISSVKNNDLYECGVCACDTTRKAQLKSRTRPGWHTKYTHLGLTYTPVPSDQMHTKCLHSYKKTDDEVLLAWSPSDLTTVFEHSKGKQKQKTKFKKNKRNKPGIQKYLYSHKPKPGRVVGHWSGYAKGTWWCDWQKKKEGNYGKVAHPTAK